MSEKSRDFDGLPSIKPDQDEVASWRRSGRSEAPRQSNFNGILVFVIVLMAIMMAIGGFTLWQVQQKLDQANKLLDKGQHDLRDLEDRLSQSGDTASKKFKEMNTQINTNTSQIDKLWASAWRRNKADIADNKDAIAGVKKSNDQLQQQFSRLKGSVDTLTAAANKMQQDWKSQADDISTQVSMVRGNVQDQSDTVEGNKREVAALDKKVNDLQGAIKVIDRYRQQVNQQLLQLQSRVQALSPAPRASSSAN